MPKPLALEVQTRLIFYERLVQSGQVGVDQTSAKDRTQPQAPDVSGGVRNEKAVRQVIQAASAINGEVRPTSAAIRPGVSLLIAQRREVDGPVVVASPSGPLTRAELELVQGLGDPLVLNDLLPSEPVAPGATWRVREAGALAVSGYDVIASNDLAGQLDSVDDAHARVRFKGQIQGSALGGAGTITCDGFASFDRRLARIDRLELNRSEDRQPGPVEAGLAVKSTLVVTRQAAAPPSRLSDSALGGMPLDVNPQRERLTLTAPGGRAVLLHDRHWHVVWDDPKLIVLKRMEHGQVVAQCNLAAGPRVAKGRHQDPNQFRDDVRRALKQRFGQFLGAGEIDGDADGGFRYKVGARGREGNLGIVWYYYLIASPEGEQLLATFTLAADHMQAFGDQDVQMIGTLRWTGDVPADQPREQGRVGGLFRQRRQ
jgi:hypothetical protein